MFMNYLKVSIRNFRKNKIQFLINVTGLTLGMATCLMIGIYIYHELSYDRYHQNTDRIYRIALNKETGVRKSAYAGCSDLAAPAIKANFSEVQSIARITRLQSMPVQYLNQVSYEEYIYFADSELFEILFIPFKRGNPATALERPRTAVLTERTVTKYFGSEDPIGKSLVIQSREYEITGIILNPPSNSHLQYGIILSWSSLEEIAEFQNNWNIVGTKTYLLLEESVDANNFGQKIKDLPHRYIGEELSRKGVRLTYFLQPITDIHLYSNLTWEFEPPGNLDYLYIFSTIGILILLIACMNFINLFTACYDKRSPEVSVRKVFGAYQKNLFYQFLGESGFLTAISLICAFALVDLSLPILHQLSGIQFSSSHLLEPEILIGSGILFILVTITAGAYPAFFLSALKPADVLKRMGRTGQSRLLLRRVLVISQFSISIILIIATLMMFKQLNYMKNKSLGFEKDQKLILEFISDDINIENYNMVKSEFIKYSQIKSAAFSSSIPGRWNYLWGVWPTGQEAEKSMRMNFFQVDHDFISDYQLQLSAGRPFDKNLKTDEMKLIVNEAAAKAFGWSPSENALGKKLGSGGNPVIGVLKDYHFRGLQEKVAPLVIYLIEDDFKYLSLTINTESLNETMLYIQEKLQRLFPDTPYDLFFLDTDFDRQYRFEERLSLIFSIFTILGIVIASLGIIGLVTYMTEQRTKEIGIRKVLGATISNIVSIISREFLILVIGANVIAWPLAWLTLNHWLDNFAYRTSIEIWVFIMAGGFALAFSLALVCFQAFTAAIKNPIEALRYE